MRGGTSGVCGRCARGALSRRARRAGTASRERRVACVVAPVSPGIVFFIAAEIPTGTKDDSRDSSFTVRTHTQSLEFTGLVLSRREGEGSKDGARAR